VRNEKLVCLSVGGIGGFLSGRSLKEFECKIVEDEGW
jgi:hypothetical protein